MENTAIYAALIYIYLNGAYVHQKLRITENVKDYPKFKVPKIFPVAKLMFSFS